MSVIDKIHLAEESLLLGRLAGRGDLNLRNECARIGGECRGRAYEGRAKF